MKYPRNLFVLPLLAMLSVACSGRHQIDAPSMADQTARAAQLAAMFAHDSVQIGSQPVPCILSGGAETSCLQLTVKSVQVGHPVGPWCPRNVADGADKAGIWLSDGKVHDADGKFIENLAAFYQDDGWQLFDAETGAVSITDSKEACQAAARPDVDPKYQNYCVECLPAYLEDEIEVTYLVPVKPVPMADSKRIDPHGGVGLALNGIRFDAPAPVEAILGAHTLAPFDDCGGHVNPHAGYHYHAVMGCGEKQVSGNGDGAIIGLALDGFMIAERYTAAGAEPDDLDACRGHVTDGLGYHYHANDPGKNQIIGCFSGEQGCLRNSDDNSCETSLWQRISRGQ